MAWTGYQLIVVALMITSGSINILGIKWADGLEAISTDGEVRKFDHPFFQASCMFLGEVLCFIIFKILYAVYKRRNDGSEDVNRLTKGNRSFNLLTLFLPAMCDVAAASLNYFGLNLTYASSFQMLRGSAIIFVALLSVGFLSRVLNKQEWLGIGLIILGLTIIGAADYISSDNNSDNHGPNDIITGDLLIVLAQVITAIQLVLEEKFVKGLDIPPLQAVGWKGIFGILVLGGLQIPFYYIKVEPPFSDNPRCVLEDAVDAFVQIGNSPILMFAVLGIIVSLGLYNFAGISVTKEMSATTRSVLDSIRIVVIWTVSLLFMGQPFHWLQLVAYIGLLAGMCVYNGITFNDKLFKIRAVILNLKYRNLTEDIENNNRAS